MISIRAADGFWLLPLRVTPRGGKDCVLPYTDGDESIRVKVSSPPEDGKANQAVIQLLAKTLGVPKSRLRLMSGETSRHKVIGIERTYSDATNSVALPVFAPLLAQALQAEPITCFQIAGATHRDQQSDE